LRMQGVAHCVARLSLDSVGVFVLQVLAASVVDGVVVRCRGVDTQYCVGDEGVGSRHRIGVARGEINGVRRRVGSDIGVELARAGVAGFQSGIWLAAPPAATVDPSEDADQKLWALFLKKPVVGSTAATLF